MAKFKVGDIVKPNDKSVGWLAITYKGNMLEGVVVHSEDDWFSVKITKMAKGDRCYEGRTFTIVRPECFDLVYRKQELHVTSDGTTTHAVLKEGGKVVKRAQAVCSPDDEYSFETGARLAVDRVFGKETEKKEPKFKFEIGDAVKVSNIYHNTYVRLCSFIKQFGKAYLARYAYSRYPDKGFLYLVRQRAEWTRYDGEKFNLYVIELAETSLAGAYYVVAEEGLVKAS